MALITCPDCNAEVSDQAQTCIKCGRPLSPDLREQPAAGSAEAAKKGRQRSKLRNDFGNAIGFVSVIVAIFAGMATSFMTGIVVALVGIGIGLYVAYGS